MLDFRRDAGAPGRRSPAWSPGPVGLVFVLLLGAICTGLAGARSEVARPAAPARIAAVESGASDESGASGTEVSPFENSVASVDALGTEVVRALGRADESALARLRLTEHEHNDVVWPELPASAPEINYPVDYAWTNIENRNRRAMARNLDTFGGRSISAHGVECRGPVEAFATFRVRTDCLVVFTVNGGVERWQAQLFKDVIERGGRYKIFRYYDAEAEPYTRPYLAGAS